MDEIDGKRKRDSSLSLCPATRDFTPTQRPPSRRFILSWVFFFFSPLRRFGSVCGLCAVMKSVPFSGVINHPSGRRAWPIGQLPTAASAENGRQWDHRGDKRPFNGSHKKRTTNRPQPPAPLTYPITPLPSRFLSLGRHPGHSWREGPACQGERGTERGRGNGR